MAFNGSTSLLNQDDMISDIATDDLLGLSAPSTAAPQGNYDPFALHVNHDTNDADIMSLASELTRGAIELETAKSMKLNDAFLSLEKMREANLEIEFGHTIDSKRCVQCIRDLPPNKRPSTPSPYRLLKARKKNHKPCLLCGNPTCSNHADKAFKKSKVMICTDCSPLFSLDFVVECVAHNNTDDPEAIQKQHRQIKHMIDVYDRVFIMLEYSAQFIDEIAEKLEQKTKKEDKIGVGCNASGVVSGMTGMAAAACFVTPAGPPLLIASLLFSGAAQMTSSGSRMVNYYSNTNKIAFKIISLYNLCKSVLTVTTVLRDALLKDHINLENYVENMIKRTEEEVLEMKTGFEEDEEETQPDDSIRDDTEEDDDDWDDVTWVSASTSDQQSVKSGIVTAYSDITEPPLAKIHEARELADSDTSGELLNSGFANLFAQSDDAETAGVSGTSGVDSGKPVEAVVTDATKNDIVMTAPKSLSLSPQKNGMTIDTSTPQKTSSQDSPSKKEQIEELKKTNHFMEREDKVGQLARFYSRSSLAGSSLVSAATVTMMAGAALSVVHFAFEANNLAATIKRIQAGSPSKRAQALRVLKEDLANLPNTSVIEAEWDKYLGVLADKRKEVSKEVSK